MLNRKEEIKIRLRSGTGAVNPLAYPSWTPRGWFAESMPELNPNSTYLSSLTGIRA